MAKFLDVDIFFLKRVGVVIWQLRAIIMPYHLVTHMKVLKHIKNWTHMNIQELVGKLIACNNISAILHANLWSQTNGSAILYSIKSRNSNNPLILLE